ncbi:MAG: DUF4266 domain-containing protein [Gammaproteobacteria bacterium]
MNPLSHESTPNAVVQTRARRAAAALALACAGLLCGCASVAPWERGHLARPQMTPEPHPAQRAVLDHAYGSREATSAGAAAKGAGCGCY